MCQYFPPTVTTSIIPHVRTLNLTHSCYHPDAEAMEDIILSLPTFPAVTSLCFYSSYPLKMIGKHLASRFPKLCTLKLPQIEYECFDDMIPFLGSLPLMTSLMLHGYFYHSGPTFGLRPSPKLEYLEALDSCVDHVLQCIMLSQPIPLIPNLHFGNIVERDLVSIGKYLRYAGSCVESLTLRFECQNAQGMYLIVSSMLLYN